MNKPILVVGAGPAGLAAAHSLACVGQRVVLVEKEAKLGGAPILSGYAKLVPSGEWAKDAIGGMVSRVQQQKEIQVKSSCRVESFDGEAGNFSARLSDGSTVEAGAAILATGFTHFDSVNKPEWGFGTFPDVVTTTQVEQMISSGRGIRCPSDGRKPQRVAILREIEKDPLFQKLRGGLVVGLYNQKEIWPVFGYEGESAIHGGYINRGFNDITWL